MVVVVMVVMVIVLEDILSGFDLEERIYRFRCVEAWSIYSPILYEAKRKRKVRKHRGSLLASVTN